MYNKNVGSLFQKSIKYLSWSFIGIFICYLISDFFRCRDSWVLTLRDAQPHPYLSRYTPCGPDPTEKRWQLDRTTEGSHPLEVELHVHEAPIPSTYSAVPQDFTYQTKIHRKKSLKILRQEQAEHEPHGVSFWKQNPVILPVLWVITLIGEWMSLLRSKKLMEIQSPTITKMFCIFWCFNITGFFEHPGWNSYLLSTFRGRSNLHQIYWQCFSDWTVVKSNQVNQTEKLKKELVLKKGSLDPAFILPFELFAQVSGFWIVFQGSNPWLSGRLLYWKTKLQSERALNWESKTYI